MKIRIAEKGDILQIIDLLMQINALHYKGRPDIFNQATSKFSTKDVGEMLEDPKRKIFVADDGIVAGYIICRVIEQDGSGLMRKNKSLWIEDFCIDETFRGQGIGHKLQSVAENYAREIDCDSVTLNVWAFNKGAMKFYESCGMTPQRTVMEKKLK